MARATPQQIAALDILDWLYFNQILVFCVYGDEELIWLHRLVSQVQKAVADTGVTGTEAECLKHTALCLLEIELADPVEKLAPGGSIPLPPGMDAKTRAEDNEYKRHFFQALVIAVGKKARPYKLDAALDIATTLFDEFRAAPPTVRYRLTERCTAFEFMLAPLDAFSWLLEMDAIRSSKCRADKASSKSSDGVIVRIGLLCEFETIRNRMMIYLHNKQKEVQVLLEKMQDELSLNAVQQLVNTMQHYQKLAYIDHRMITFDADRCRDPSYVRQFLAQYRQLCHRSRLLSGSQANWLGMVGAAMVSLDKSFISPDAPIYVESDNTGSITERVSALLLKRGCTINARTLYERYRYFEEQLCERVRLYAAAQRRTDAAPPAEFQDFFYNANIVVTME